MALWDPRQALCSTVRQPRFILNVSVTCCIPHVFPPTALRRLRFPLSVILPGSPSFTRCQREHLAVRLLLTFHSRCCGALSAPGGQPRAKEPPLPPGPPPGEKARPELTRLQSKSKEIGHRNEGITKRCFLCKGRRACPSWPEHSSQEGGLTEGVLNMQAARSPRCSGTTAPEFPGSGDQGRAKAHQHPSHHPDPCPARASCEWWGPQQSMCRVSSSRARVQAPNGGSKKTLCPARRWWLHLLRSNL